MKVLEARFYPRSKSGAAMVVIGRITWPENRPSIEPVVVLPQAIRPFDADGLVAKLRFLVESAGPNSYTELLNLRSDYWSFVEVNLDTPRAA